MKKSTLLHLRVPFSFFLLPVFLLACASASTYSWPDLLLCFFILHLLVYPASNGYNSYFDKDEQSIGGLKHPPKVSKELYQVSILLDLIALILSLLISLEFTLMVLIYGLVSKAYSHPAIRLKKQPILGWLAAGIFQGYFTFLLSIMAMESIRFTDTLIIAYQLPAILTTVLLLGSYPMTQVYQHEEDEKRGDRTISRLLGILGTFHFTAIAFALASAGFFYYFSTSYSLLSSILFLVFLAPVLIFFGVWYMKVRSDRLAADHTNTMRLNLISSLMLNAFFIYLWVS
ncbi:MAG: UbiA family prenyltransferase [Bacteroidota bacterium]